MRHTYPLLRPHCTKRGANEFVRHDFFVKFKCRDETRGSFSPRLRPPREFCTVRPEYAIQKLLYTVFHNTIHTAEQKGNVLFLSELISCATAIACIS